MNDIRSDFNLNSLAGTKPTGVGYLDAEIAGEGVKVSEGEKVEYQIPTANLVIPDYSKIKRTRAADGTLINFQKYFYRTGFEPFPAWIYHPTEPDRIVANQEEGAEYGVYYRETTPDEQMRLEGKKAIWDWSKDTLWRPMPYKGTAKPDVNAYGKELIVAAPNPAVAQNQLLAALVDALGKNTQASSASAQTALVEALVAALNKSGGALPAAPTEEPVAFADADTPVPELGEREAWEAEAERLGIKVDKRWGLQRLKDEIQKAL